MLKKQRFYLLFVFAAFLVFSVASQAAISPVAIDIFAPVQFPPTDFNVTGVRVSAFFGHHRTMHGIDLAAIGNETDLEFVGPAVAGGFNLTQGNTTILGVQIAGLANINNQKTTVIGLQAAAVNNNNADSSIYGVNVGLVNVSQHTTVNGVQVGLYNKSYEVNGFQIGVLNFTTSLHGLQIGLLNFNDKGLFSVCPILNAGF